MIKMQINNSKLACSRVVTTKAVKALDLVEVIELLGVIFIMSITNAPGTT